MFVGRTYLDFKEKHCDEMDFDEMDTVLSAKGSAKCILTLYFPCMKLLIGRLMNHRTEGAVKAEFEKLQKALDGPFEFSLIFPVMLTDRGSKFGDPEALECDKDGDPRTSIYYCDPIRSCQKGGIEEVNTMLRMIIPKGTILEGFTQWDIRKAVDYINNALRKNWLQGGAKHAKMSLTYFVNMLYSLFSVKQHMSTSVSE